MKVRVSTLRRMIREELTRNITEGWKVKYIGKDGKPAQATFPNEKLANMYAANLKGATVEMDDTQMKDVAVQAVAPASLDDLRASSKAFYKQAQAGEKFVPRETPQMKADREEERAFSIEQEAELEGEFWAASRAAGQSQEDAFKDRDFMRARAAKPTPEDEFNARMWASSRNRR